MCLWSFSRAKQQSIQETLMGWCGSVLLYNVIYAPPCWIKLHFSEEGEKVGGQQDFKKWGGHIFPPIPSGNDACVPCMLSNVCGSSLRVCLCREGGKNCGYLHNDFNVFYCFLDFLARHWKGRNISLFSITLPRFVDSALVSGCYTVLCIVCHKMKTDLCLTLITCLTTNWHLC